MLQMEADKKQKLADELDRLANVIDALVTENSHLKETVKTLVDLLEAQDEIASVTVDDTCVQVRWNK